MRRASPLPVPRPGIDEACGLAAAFGRDGPAALIEDAVAIMLGVVMVGALR